MFYYQNKHACYLLIIFDDGYTEKNVYVKTAEVNFWITLVKIQCQLVIFNSQ